MKLRLTNLDSAGRKVVTLWSFDPLFDNSAKPDFLITRKSGRDASANFTSKPLAENAVIRISFGADCLADDTNYENFQRFLQAHKIEVMKLAAGKETYTEFGLEQEEEISFDHLEDVAHLVFKEFKIVETGARWYNKWYKA